MTVNEAVNANDDILFVGSAAGYVFIGTPEDFDDVIDIFCDAYHERAVNSLRDAEKEYARARSEIMINDSADIKAMIKAIDENKDIQLDRSPLIRRVRNTLEIIRTRPVAIEKLSRQLVNWTSWRDREVIRIEPIERGTQIIFKGEEAGDFWLEEECQYAMRKIREKKGAEVS